MLLDEIDYDKLSPMMKLYVETKRQVADCILFYRLGEPEAMMQACLQIMTPGGWLRQIARSVCSSR